MADAKVKNPLKAVYVVKEKLEKSVYKTKGMATLVWFEKGIRLVTWSGAIKANGRNGTLIAERFSRHHIGAYKLTVSIFRVYGNFTFLQIDSQSVSNKTKTSNGKDKLLTYLNFEVPKNNASNFEASSFSGSDDFKLSFKYKTNTGNHEVEEAKDVDLWSVIGAPFISECDGGKYSVVGLVGLTEEKNICPYFVKRDLFGTATGGETSCSKEVPSVPQSANCIVPCKKDPGDPACKDGPTINQNKHNQEQGAKDFQYHRTLKEEKKRSLETQCAGSSKENQGGKDQSDSATVVKGANSPQDQRTLKEEKGGGGTQPGGLSSKENEERETTDGQPDKPDSGIQPSDDTEPGANSPQDQRTLKEEKGGGGTQPGGLSSKENEERETTDGQPDKPDSRIQPSDNTEPGNAPQDQRTLKEEKGGGGTQPGGRSSKENEERKTTDGQPNEPDSGIQPSDSTEPAAKGSHDQRTLEEERRGRGTQNGGSSKENQGRKTTDGERDQLHSGTQTRDKTKPGREEQAEENTHKNDQEIKMSIEATDERNKTVSVLRPRERSSRLSTNVLDIPSSVYRSVCIKLNSKCEVSFNDYRILCEYLGYDGTVALGLEQQTTANPTDELLWIWSTRDADEATVGNLIKLLKKEDLNRMDVVKILEDWVKGDPHSRLSTRAFDVPPHIKRRICLLLNREDILCRDYRMVAEKLKYNRDEIEGLKQGKENPTDTLIRMYCNEYGVLPVSRLIESLKKKREDVVMVLENWVDGR